MQTTHLVQPLQFPVLGSRHSFEKGKSEVHRVGNEDSYDCWKFPLPAIIVTFFLDFTLCAAELGEISANLS